MGGALIEQLVATGRIADLALAVLAAEAFVLAVLGRRAGRSLVPLVCNVGAGAGLLLALRAALTAAGATMILVPLALALVCHLLDTLARLKH